MPAGKAPIAEEAEPAAQTPLPESVPDIPQRRARVSLRELTHRADAGAGLQSGTPANTAPEGDPYAGAMPGGDPHAEAAQGAAAPAEGDNAAAAPGDPAAPEEPPKPKLAYILRRGSEGAVTESYTRMTEMLKKRGQ